MLTECRQSVGGPLAGWRRGGGGKTCCAHQYGPSWYASALPSGTASTTLYFAPKSSSRRCCWRNCDRNADRYARQRMQRRKQSPCGVPACLTAWTRSLRSFSRSAAKYPAMSRGTKPSGSMPTGARAVSARKATRRGYKTRFELLKKLRVRKLRASRPGDAVCGAMPGKRCGGSWC